MYHYMTGGQFIAHPGGVMVTYTVHIVDPEHPLTRGIKDFTVTSEQYYMHVDPANFVLTTTNFGDVVMPVSWIKMWGKGRVFYSSLGHKAKVVRQLEVLELMKRGMLWAAEKQV
jgi:type 1 glutamine amidotransferase